MMPMTNPDTGVYAEHRDADGALHNADGPAVIHQAWLGAPITVAYFWHGTKIPDAAIKSPNKVALADVLALDDSESRAATLQAIGPARSAKLASKGATVVDRCPDPANPPHELLLLEPSSETMEALDIPEGTLRLLQMTNASPERDGSVRQYVEGVPGETTSALAAAAWQAGVTPGEYQRLQRAT